MYKFTFRSGCILNRGRDAPAASRADAGRVLGRGVPSGAALHRRVREVQD